MSKDKILNDGKKVSMWMHVFLGKAEWTVRVFDRPYMVGPVETRDMWENWTFNNSADAQAKFDEIVAGGK